MYVREAVLSDIPQLQIVRGAVTENVLSNPALVTHAHYVDYLTQRGKGWVCESGNTIVGFAVVSTADNNVWALFILPAYEGQGIGKKLQQHMLQWYFAQTEKTVWLHTDAYSRAAAFYRKSGWKEVGWHNHQEIKFEMDFATWQQLYNA